jgi:hypothetical protein
VEDTREWKCCLSRAGTVAAENDFIVRASVFVILIGARDEGAAQVEKDVEEGVAAGRCCGIQDKLKASSLPYSSRSSDEDPTTGKSDQSKVGIASKAHGDCGRSAIGDPNRSRDGKTEGSDDDGDDRTVVAMMFSSQAKIDCGPYCFEQFGFMDGGDARTRREVETGTEVL